MLERLIRFLQDDLDISKSEVELALRHTQAIPHQLPIKLWQYGLINLGQLEQVFDWLEAA